MNANLLRLLYIIAACGLVIYALDSFKQTAAAFKPLEGSRVEFNLQGFRVFDLDNGNGGGNGG